MVDTITLYWSLYQAGQAYLLDFLNFSYLYCFNNELICLASLEFIFVGLGWFQEILTCWTKKERLVNKLNECSGKRNIIIVECGLVPPHINMIRNIKVKYGRTGFKLIENTLCLSLFWKCFFILKMYNTHSLCHNDSISFCVYSAPIMTFTAQMHIILSTF